MPKRFPSPSCASPRRGGFAVRADARGAVELQRPDPEPVRPRRPVRVLLLEPRAAAAEPGDVRLAPGYLEAVRYKPLDATYSYIANRADQDALYSASQFVGLGMTTPFDGVELRVSEVFPDSPASEAGLKRGDRFLTRSTDAP